MLCVKPTMHSELMLSVLCCSFGGHRPIIFQTLFGKLASLTDQVSLVHLDIGPVLGFSHQCAQNPLVCQQHLIMLAIQQRLSQDLSFSMSQHSHSLALQAPVWSAQE